MDSYKRIMTTLELKQPDRVPIGEFIVDKKVRNGFGKNYKDSVDLAFGEGLDLVGTVAHFATLETFSDGTFIDEWGCIYKTSNEFIAHPIKGPIEKPADLKNYQFPDPYAINRLGGLEKLVEKADGKLVINFHCRVAFMWSVFLMGMDNLLMAMILHPTFVHELFTKVTDVNIEVIRRAVRSGANTISFGDDYSGNKGPLMSPKMFREFILPHLKRAVDVVHQEGAKCIKHTDGNIWPILDMMIEAGIDCINPLEPVANMDVAKVKAKYGKQICIMGNIDCGELLCHGSKTEVEQAVKECIEKGAAGGGLIISSSNSIHSGVNPQNYSAMIQAVKKWGKYPLNNKM